MMTQVFTDAQAQVNLSALEQAFALGLPGSVQQVVDDALGSGGERLVGAQVTRAGVEDALAAIVAGGAGVVEVCVPDDGGTS